ncbi:MAG: DUF2662 domain-containing protein [Chloroflexi bacterium]|jgi:hypothetical protein|uniref:FHA domain-containing protein n=1 Tax=Candidatus Thermofonsia Clade 3 bacterium TaxID=2364212 RepID=A0A2M8QDA8_9CHLR|nr:FhaA domain-containing protein [Candidatus Roseilinea sp. NK_OTU-006]PJF47784.1 MAG: hypothetical protein CUN48_06800 [Candidatus Thermofonsia Clade 3 bacterium]RMG64599.1 MAG: DUF2662 domain-containing protein [Chloroflexota bacterium]
MHRFEDLAQQLIEASLARALGGKLEASEVLRAIVRAIEDAQAGAGAPIIPNHFWVTLNDGDLRALEAARPRLADELSEQARQIMLQMGLRLDAPPRVLLWGAPHVAPHRLQVKARWIAPNLMQADTSATPALAVSLPRRPFLIVDGQRQISLTSTLVRIGRAHDNHVIVDDRRVSRHHLELRWQNDLARFLAVDLNSSGGTRLNGYPIQQCTLEAGDVLSLGGVEIIYGEEFTLQSTTALPPAP